jgi:hypothetical protein
MFKQAEAVSRLAILEINECNAKIPKASTIVEPTLADFIFKHPVKKNSLPLPPISMLTLNFRNTLAHPLPHPGSKWSGPGCVHPAY